MLDQIHTQVDKVTVINNTLQPLQYRLGDILLPLTEKYNNVEEIIPTDKLLYGQSLNFAVRDSHKNGYEVCLWAHCDIEVRPGAVDALFHKYEEIKDQKWGQILSNYDSLCLFNPAFFVNENIWEDVYVLPTYFWDNARAYLMKKRGYSIHGCPEAAQLVTHLGSHTIHRNPIYNAKNGLVFKWHEKIYIEMCGGPPGHETKDATLGGLYP
jgi:hypothetical protein